MGFAYGSEENLRKILNVLADDDSILEVVLRVRTDDNFHKLRAELLSEDSNFADAINYPENNSALFSETLRKIEKLYVLSKEQKILPLLALSQDTLSTNISQDTGSIPVRWDNSSLPSELRDVLLGLRSAALIPLGFKPYMWRLKNSDIFDHTSSSFSRLEKHIVNEKSQDYELLSIDCTLSPRTDVSDHYYTRSSNGGNIWTYFDKLIYNGPNAGAVYSAMEDIIRTPMEKILNGEFSNRKLLTSS